MLASFRWAVSTAGKFFRVVPFETSIVVLATLVSQAAILLAFFLPLKVIILLGSEGVPPYFPAAFTSLDRDFLLIVLSGAAIGSYIVYLLSESVVRYGAERGARRLLERSRKTVLFRNHEVVALHGYQRYSKMLASAVFVMLAMSLLALLYPALAVLILFYSATTFLVLVILCAANEKVRDRMRMQMHPIMSVVAAAGFLISFSYLVSDFLLWSPPGLVVAVIALLLSRQVCMRAASVVADLASLYGDRIKLNALFFHGHAMRSSDSRQEHEFWSLLDKKERERWMSLLLGQVVGHGYTISNSKLLETGIPGVAAVNVDDRFIVKLFNARRRARSLHEAALLLEFRIAGLPMLSLLGVETVDTYSCHVFGELGPSAMCANEQSGVNVRRARIALLGIEPSADLVDCYRRSKPMLAQRLSAGMTQRLLTIVDEGKQEQVVQDFADKIEGIKRFLSGFPLWIHNPDIYDHTVMQRKDGGPAIIHWGGWSVEPLGAGWPVREAEVERLANALAEASASRHSLSRVLPRHVRLAALTFHFEALYRAERYSTALDLLPEILACFDPAEKLKMVRSSR